MGGQLHASAALPAVPIRKEVGLAPEMVWTRWREEENPITPSTGN